MNEAQKYVIILNQSLQFCISDMYMQQEEKRSDNQSEQEKKHELKALLIQIPGENPHTRLVPETLLL